MLILNSSPRPQTLFLLANPHFHFTSHVTLKSVNLLWRLAFRNLLRHKWRSLATVIGVALGIAAVLATLSVGDNVRKNVAETLEAAAGKADLLITPGAQGRFYFAIDDILGGVQVTPGVATVYPVLNERAEPLRDVKAAKDSVIPGVDSGFQVSGRVTSVPEDLPVKLLEGDIPTEGSNGIVIASGFARGRSITVGETLEFAYGRKNLVFTVTGLMDDSFGYASTNGGRVGLVNLTDLQTQINQLGKASFLEILLDDKVVPQDVQNALQTTVGDAYTVTLPASSGNVALGVVDTLEAGLRILAATLLALGAFMAYNTFSAAIVERTREYALLRTICMTKGHVRNLALLESFLLSVLGVIVGLLLGIVLAYLIVRLNSVALGFEFRTLVIPGYSVAVACAIGVLISLVAGYLPATAASNTPPIVASRQSTEAGAVRYPHLGWLFIALGIGAALFPWVKIWSLLGALLAMAFLFLGIAFVTPFLLRPTLAVLTPILTALFGLPGKLGADFARRNAVRNGVAIGTVVIGVALTVGVGAMVSGINRAISQWVETTLLGDLFVTSPVNFPENFAEDASQAVPELEQVSGVGVRIVRFEPVGQEKGRSVALVLADPERFNPETGFGKFQYIEGQGSNQEGYEALKTGGYVLAANTIRDRFGVNKGDTVRLRTNDGFKDFVVGGVVVDFTGGGETFVASLDDADLFGGGQPDLFVMTVKQGADSSRARDKLIAAFPELYLDITLNATYRKRILELTQRSFVTTNGLLGLAIFISALGVANTLGMNLVNRHHDIAVLRTLGLTRRKIGRVIIAEGIVVAVLGTILGLGCGVLLSKVITEGANALTGFLITPYFPPRLILLSLLASPVLGIVASYFPARRAAKQSPMAAFGSAS
jgi:putative ABC transport system permease protein